MYQLNYQSYAQAAAVPQRALQLMAAGCPQEMAQVFCHILAAQPATIAPLELSQQLGLSVLQLSLIHILDASGNVAVATGSDRYLGQVSVYDRNQQLVFGWSSSKEYILSVSMGSGGNLAVACVNAVDGRVTTVVYALNIHREEELSRTEFPGSLALQMRWEGSTIQLVCDDQVFALKKDGTVLSTTDIGKPCLDLSGAGKTLFVQTNDSLEKLTL